MFQAICRRLGLQVGKDPGRKEVAFPFRLLPISQGYLTLSSFGLAGEIGMGNSYSFNALGIGH